MARILFVLAMGLVLAGCGANKAPSKTAAQRRGGSGQHGHLPPKPSPVTSGSSATTSVEPKAQSTGQPLSASKSGINLSTSGFRGSSATISLPPPPLHERHDLLAGWIDLYDGATLFGWTAQSKANWKTDTGMLTVSEGEPGLLTTDLEFGDYHLRVDFRAEAGTNSGIFLHTNDKPSKEDITTRCYEVNIAPDSNPFPTGSIVGRVKADHSVKEGTWRSLEAKVEGGHITIFVDGQMTADYTDPRPLRRGKIGLQFNSGAIEFREVKIRPLGLGLFGEGGGQAGWKLDPKSKSALEVGADGELRFRGGKGFLESEKQFKDFVLQVEARTNRENQNSGIFFRTMPGSEMNG